MCLAQGHNTETLVRLEPAAFGHQVIASLIVYAVITIMQVVYITGSLWSLIENYLRLIFYGLK